jgi:murein DD-endopeptidase MepM/ murein hydrolase activator NlpD
MRKVLLGLLLVSSCYGFSQNTRTINTEEDLIFDTDQEEFFLDNTFDGILNHDIHRQVSKDPKLNFSMSWDNDFLFASKKRNSIANLNDTLWLCVGDSVSNEFRIPFDGYLTSHFGPRHGRPHHGVDISLKTGDMIYAAWSGKVRYAKFNKGGYGNLVVIRHYNGLETFYAHLSKILVLPNQDVVAGEPIGLGGNTGRSFGPHLHFEVRFYDIPINPEHIIDFAKKDVKDPNVLVHKDIFKVHLPGDQPKIEFPEEDTEDQEHDHSIDAGEVLAGVALPLANKSETTTENKNTAPKEFRKYHKVKSGDNLTKIANLYGTSVDKICELNGLKANRTIDVGQMIRVR